MEDIGIFSYSSEASNPTIASPNSPFELPFKQTRDSLMDVESYKAFLDNAMSAFRHSKTYRNYKSFLIELGMDKCQVHGNITTEMVGAENIEMHHNMLTLFDIAIILTEHTLNTIGSITTFDLIKMLKDEHKAHRIQLVMLTKTPHELYHDNSEFFIHPSMCIGKWWEFLYMYRDGITREIANKIIRYLDRAIIEGKTNDNGLLNLRNDIYNWSAMNGY